MRERTERRSGRLTAEALRAQSKEFLIKPKRSDLCELRVSAGEVSFAALACSSCFDFFSALPRKSFLP